MLVPAFSVRMGIWKYMTKLENMRLVNVIGLTLLLIVGHPKAYADQSWSLSSKDKKTCFVLRNELIDGHTKLTYQVLHDQETAMEKSKLEIVMDGISYGTDARFVSASPIKEVHDEYVLKSGKQLRTMDDCREQTFVFQTSLGNSFQIIVRAYDDGVAFRYSFPQTDGKSHQIDAENTEFAVPVQGKAWIHPYDWNSRKKPSYETYCDDAIPIRDDNHHEKGWAFPMLFHTNNLWMMVTEACLDGTYPATHLNNLGANKAYRITFPEAEEPVIADAPYPVSTLPWQTPWRVIIVGKALSTIFQTQMVSHLNPPCSWKDVSWIKPGRSCWSWWYRGGTVTDYPTQLQYVRLSKEMGWEYILIDAGWQRMQNGGKMEDVVRYANEQGVGVWLWYHSGAGRDMDTIPWNRAMSDQTLRRQEMKYLQEIGVKGIKVDFFDTDKQRIIQLYPAILQDAAKYHLMVDFHGATLPRGFERTYPNLMTTEAVRGAESLGQQARCDRAAWHNSILPFTRNVVGSMDYTPVTFSNKIRRGVEAFRMTTVAHQLALSVVFESGFQCFADRAEAYLSLPDKPKSFLKAVPAAWDESILLSGFPGDYVVVARRAGDVWYLGGINGKPVERELTFTLPKDCRGKAFEVIGDGKDKDNFGYQKLTQTNGMVRVHVLPNGGFSAIIK
jgi:alpha-glucosidase